MGRDGRVASNEGLLRDVNDRIEEVTQRFGNGEEGSEADGADFLCECGQENCTESVRMSVREYEELRRDENHFVVFPGHEDPDVEDVVATYGRYTVVRKHPAEASIAEETDPHRH
jgi:hypothetical protein